MGKGAGKGEAGYPLLGADGAVVQLADGSVHAVKRSFNFCAGPAMLDSDAMLNMWKSFCDFQGTGVSLIEMSQRDKGGPVQTIISAAVENIRTLLSVPDNYKILLFQGGAHGQFAAVPLNLCGSNDHAQYLNGGFWSARAMSEGRKYMTRVSEPAASCTDAITGKLKYPDVSEWDIDSSAAYLHIVSNETIEGLELPDVDVGDAVLVADMTSTLLSRPVDVSKYGVIYASGGKNLGPAGVCVVIVREDLLDKACPQVPSVLSWSNMYQHNNLYNTQCTFAIWAMKTITDGLLQQGGLKVVEQKVLRRAHDFYSILDSSSGFYTNNVAPECRSRTSVPFRVLGGDVQLESLFIQEAQAAGLFQLAGHHSVGGLRVCLYNGIPDEALRALCFFMVSFQERYYRQA
eukprot:jgi/Ulvmu1/8070/UM004_0307.1